MTNLDTAMRKLAFQLQDDGGIAVALFEFAQSEGYTRAIERAEEWRNGIEDILEVTKAPNHPMRVFLVLLHKSLNLTITNLLIQEKSPCS